MITVVKRTGLPQSSHSHTFNIPMHIPLDAVSMKRSDPLAPNRRKAVMTELLTFGNEGKNIIFLRSRASSVKSRVANVVRSKNLTPWQPLPCCCLCLAVQRIPLSSRALMPYLHSERIRSKVSRNTKGTLSAPFFLRFFSCPKP